MIESHGKLIEGGIESQRLNTGLILNTSISWPNQIAKVEKGDGFVWIDKRQQVQLARNIHALWGAVLRIFLSVPGVLLQYYTISGIPGNEMIAFCGSYDCGVIIRYGQRHRVAWDVVPPNAKACLVIPHAHR